MNKTTAFFLSALATAAFISENAQAKASKAAKKVASQVAAAPVVVPAVQEVAPVQSAKAFDVSGKVAYVTDYISKGQSQTFGGPGVQAEINLTKKVDCHSFNVGLAGYNVSADTAPNGSNLELNPAVSYKFSKEDWSVGLGLKGTVYPGAYANATKDHFNMLDIIPAVSYKWFEASVSYAFTNKSGVSNNFMDAAKKKGGSHGSWFAQIVATVPVGDYFEFQAGYGYQKVPNYKDKNYSAYHASVFLKLPEVFKDMKLNVTYSGTNTKKGEYDARNTQESWGKTKNTTRNVVWAGLTKSF